MEPSSGGKASPEREIVEPNAALRLIGLFYDNPQQDYVIQVQEGTLRTCRRQGYQLVIHPYGSTAVDLVDTVLAFARQPAVEGCVLTSPLSDDKKLLNGLCEAGIPYARLSQRPGICDTPWVSANDEDAAREMTEYLISLGHRRIAHIMGHPAHGAAHDRLKGYRAALAAHDIPEEKGFVHQGYFNFASGQTCAAEILSTGERPTAIFASNDHMAMGALEAAHEREIKIPEELSICGFDDVRMSRYAWPPLTTFHQPVRKAAGLATEMLVKLIRGEPLETRHVELRSELVARCTAASP